MDWDKLRVFQAAAEAGSFTHAGEKLHLSQSAVSRQISSLENSLNVALFHRHARGLILTEQGEVLFSTTKDVFTKLSTTEALISEGRERPKGKLRITTTVAFGSTWLASRIGRFIDIYPEVNVTLLIDDSELDLSMMEADVAVRLTPLKQPDLIQRHLKTIRFHLYASPRYTENNGIPNSIEELGDHRTVIYGESPNLPYKEANWLLDLLINRARATTQKIVRVNNVYGIFRAVQGGVGIAALPDYLAAEDPSLLRILPDIEGPAIPAFFVYPEELKRSKRISVLKDFLIQEVAKTAF
ncbi:MAG: LysR family transcriptional regulator [Rhodospirillaceae bacterium]|nr:LysR family transcriptional regulator [Rhodospirillaceae bacterium]|tara:strand:+ start:99 stop:992 length:894 start_codon:yes stop_codon:yes gene_type:complete